MMTAPGFYYLKASGEHYGVDEVLMDDIAHGREGWKVA
jgi:hypothetical protein